MTPSPPSPAAPWKDRALAAGTVLALAAALVLVRWFVLRTGGIQYSFSHLFYVPIVVSGALFGTFGGALCGLAAGAVAAAIPISPLTGEMQTVANWSLRMGMFVLVGGLNGLLMQRANLELIHVQNLLANTCSLLGNVLRGFASAVSAKDAYTGGHCERVAHNAYSIARQMGLDGEARNRVYFAGLLHDLGKIGVPDAILNKAGKLSADEQTAMRRHAAIGHEIISEVAPDMGGIAAGIRQHHERWDGRGYPDGLEGEGITLTGRILAVVDVFEALTTKRSYRDPLPEDEALGLLQKARGAHFDPLVMDAFLAAHRLGHIQVCQGDECWRDLPKQVDVSLARLLLHEDGGPSWLGALKAMRLRRRAPEAVQGCGG